MWPALGHKTPDHSRTAAINATLSELNRKTGRIAQFSVEDGNELMCIHSIGRSPSFFSMYTEVGRKSPLYCTSAGKALLAAYTNSQITERWNQLGASSLTKNTIVDLQEFLRDIAETRRRQYALNIEENEYGVFCIGTIVMGSDGKPVGAISVTGDSLAKTEERQIAALLLPAARLLSRSFGYLDGNLMRDA